MRTDGIDIRRLQIWLPVIAFLASRLPLLAVSYLCLRLFPIHAVEPWQVDPFPGVNWINGWIRWDSLWYESIVDDGALRLPPGFSNANFFPFYSWAAWVVSLPLRPLLSPSHAFFVAGLGLSHASFLAALIGVCRLASDKAGEKIGSYTIWLMAFFPFSFFFSAVYADALYLCLVVWCFWFARRRRWYLAAALATMAAMTRIPGLALIPALIGEYGTVGSSRRPALARSIVPGLILAVGPMVLALYFMSRYGSPLAFVHARQTGWHRATGLGAFRSDFAHFTQGSIGSCGAVADCLREPALTRQLVGAWYLGLIPTSAALIVWASRRLGIGPTLWALGSILMALANGLDSTGRFTAVLFPAFVALAMILRRGVVVMAACAAFLPFLLFFAAQFARWQPIL